MPSIIRVIRNAPLVLTCTCMTSSYSYSTLNIIIIVIVVIVIIISSFIGQDQDRMIYMLQVKFKIIQKN